LSENRPGKPHQPQQVLHSLTSSSSPQQRPRQSPIVNSPDKEKEEEEEDEEQQQKTVKKQRTKQQQQQQQQQRRRRRKRTKTTNKAHWKLDRFQRFLDQKMQGKRPDVKARELPSSRHSEKTGTRTHLSRLERNLHSELP
jgi:hypothetical protein